MTTSRFRLSVVAFICATSLASRPTENEVHIATNGNFISNSGIGSRHHGRGHHTESAQAWKNRKNLEEQVHQREQGQMTFDSQELLWKSKEDIDLEHEMFIQRAKRQFYKDAATAYEPGESDYTDDMRNWSDSWTYMVCRIAFVMAALYALAMYTFVPQMKDSEKSILAFVRARQRQEECGPSAPVKETCGAAAESTEPADHGCQGEMENDEAGEQVEESFTQAINDRLREVERWLRNEVQEDEQAEESQQTTKDASQDSKEDSKDISGDAVSKEAEQTEDAQKMPPVLPTDEEADKAYSGEEVENDDTTSPEIAGCETGSS